VAAYWKKNFASYPLYTQMRLFLPYRVVLYNLCFEERQDDQRTTLAPPIVPLAIAVATRLLNQPHSRHNNLSTLLSAALLLAQVLQNHHCPQAKLWQSVQEQEEATKGVTAIVWTLLQRLASKGSSLNLPSPPLPDRDSPPLTTALEPSLTCIGRKSTET
jgi:hypothetical protein